MKSLFVGNVDFAVTADVLRDLFADCGRVLSVMIPRHAETREPRGFAFVNMGDELAAARALETLNGYVILGRALRIKESSTEPPKPRAKAKARRRRAPKLVPEGEPAEKYF